MTQRWSIQPVAIVLAVGRIMREKIVPARSERRGTARGRLPRVREPDAVRHVRQLAPFSRRRPIQHSRTRHVDDHPLLRDLINRFLAKRSGIVFVARACAGLEAMSLAVVHQPDLVVTNLFLPGLLGLELTRCLAAP